MHDVSSSEGITGLRKVVTSTCFRANLAGQRSWHDIILVYELGLLLSLVQTSTVIF